MPFAPPRRRFSILAQNTSLRLPAESGDVRSAAGISGKCGYDCDMPASTERELKFDVPNKFSLLRLAEHLGPYRLSAPELHRLHTTYYDTDDLRLTRWGASLRYRQGDAWTLKLPEPPKNGAVYRTELTFSGEASRIPDAVLDLAATGAAATQARCRKSEAGDQTRNRPRRRPA